MGAKKQAALFSVNILKQRFSIVNADIEMIQLITEKKDAVKNGGGKTVNMPKHMMPTGPTAKDPGQIDAGRFPLLTCLEQKIAADGIQQKSGCGPAKMLGNSENQTQSQRTPALRLL